jgi:hypothetical protein
MGLNGNADLGQRLRSFGLHRFRSPNGDPGAQNPDTRTLQLLECDAETRGDLVHTNLLGHRRTQSIRAADEQ